MLLHTFAHFPVLLQTFAYFDALLSIFATRIFLSTGFNVSKMKKEVEVKKHHGLSVITASLIMVGEMAGSGVLALPGAMVGIGITFSTIIF